MATDRALDIYRNGQMVGTLFDTSPLTFRYANSWLHSDEAAPISPDLRLAQQEHFGQFVHAYFENLLPEGDLRRYLNISQHATTVFGLLSAVGGDTASGLSILLQGEKPTLPTYQPTSWDAIAAMLRDPGNAPLIAQNAIVGRVSLAGAQDKMLIVVNPDGTPSIPLGSAPSITILKPDIVRLQNVWSTALNEAFVMKLGAAVNLGVAEASYQSIVKSCLVKRYDRSAAPDGTLRRMHQLDLCQLDGKSSDIKYESDGGPTLARCRELLQQNHVPAVDLRRLLEWLFFNLYVGNNDSHAKNLSILHTSNEGTRLAPFYDLMSTTLYAGLSKKFAFKIGGEDNPGNIRVEHIGMMAAEMGFKPKYVLNIADKLAEKLLANIDPIENELRKIARAGTEQTLLERLSLSITSNTKKLGKRWSGRATSHAGTSS